jgi:hypothetical protein
MPARISESGMIAPAVRCPFTVTLLASLGVLEAIVTGAASPAGAPAALTGTGAGGVAATGAA